MCTYLSLNCSDIPGSHVTVKVLKLGRTDAVSKVGAPLSRIGALRTP